jgi:hypothetical protein
MCFLFYESVSIFMPLVIKCQGHYVMAYALVASVSVDIWFPPIMGQTPGSIDPIFCGLSGVTRGRFLSLISSAAHPRWPLQLGRLIRFLCGSLGVNRGRFLSMISSAAHPRWPLIQDGRYSRHIGFGFRRLDDKRLSMFYLHNIQSESRFVHVDKQNIYMLPNITLQCL